MLAHLCFVKFSKPTFCAPLTRFQVVSPDFVNSHFDCKLWQLLLLLLLFQDIKSPYLLCAVTMATGVKHGYCENRKGAWLDSFKLYSNHSCKLLFEQDNSSVSGVYKHSSRFQTF